MPDRWRDAGVVLNPMDVQGTHGFLQPLHSKRRGSE
jgi:hypothetical protein